MLYSSSVGVQMDRRKTTTGTTTIDIHICVEGQVLSNDMPTGMNENLNLLVWELGSRCLLSDGSNWKVLNKGGEGSSQSDVAFLKTRV